LAVSKNRGGETKLQSQKPGTHLVLVFVSICKANGTLYAPPKGEGRCVWAQPRIATPITSGI